MSVRVKDPRKYPIIETRNQANRQLSTALKTLDPSAIDRVMSELSLMMVDGAIAKLRGFLDGCKDPSELKLAHMLATDIFNVCRPMGPRIVNIEETENSFGVSMSMGENRDHFLLDVAMPLTVQLDPNHDDNEDLAEPREFDLEIIKGFAQQMFARMRLPICAQIEGQWEIKSPEAMTASQQLIGDGKWFSEMPIYRTVALGTSCLQPASSRALVTMEPKLFFCCARIKVMAEEYKGRHTTYAGLYPSDLSDNLQAQSMAVIDKFVDERLFVVMGSPMLAGHTFEVARGMMRQARLLAFDRLCVFEDSTISYAFGSDANDQSWLYVSTGEDSIVLPLSRLEPWDNICYGFQQMFHDAAPVEVAWSSAFLEET